MSANKLRIAILCGGPSPERGISLNSARSVCDHLESHQIELIPIYFDHKKRAYAISRAQLYSNTPSDFDFKLKNTAKPLSQILLRKLLKKCDLAFPVMHGAFGEDGDIQKILEKFNLPYVGSGAEACKRCFDKFRANEYIRKQGFNTVKSSLLKIHAFTDNKKTVENFFAKEKCERAIVKPATGGSSIGVYSVRNADEALEAAQTIFSKRLDTRAVIEPFCQGTEFTVIILQNRFGLPVAIFPTEIEIDYRDNNIFDYRKKYLASNHVTYHCPPRFKTEIIEKIQIQAEQLFTCLGMNDFARFDGWLLDDGNIWFSDLNPISGMEQNSFLFLQAAQIGFSHSDLLHFILRNSCQRQGLVFPDVRMPITEKKARKPINVIFGGKTAERQVSVMSGINVWLKLRHSEKFAARPFLLDKDDNTVWRLPYSKTLNHTVEEISSSCKLAESAEETLKPLRRRVLEKIAAKPGNLNEELFVPEKMTLKNFIKNSEFVFICLHGGIGENGVLQGMLEKSGVKFNGSGSRTSSLCMDKYMTAEKLKGLEKEGIYSSLKKIVHYDVLAGLTVTECKKLWKNLKSDLAAQNLIIKPRCDGCSAGIIKLCSAADLKVYCDLLKRRVPFIPQQTFIGQMSPIDMPTEFETDFILEQYVITDKVKTIANKLHWTTVSGWIEITMGVRGRGKNLKAFNPSLTVASGEILSLEEKFQGGTGVNITPPPQPYVKKKAIEAAKKRMEIVAGKLGISNYARIDAFMEVSSGKLIIIEANTTPALTPSTVLYHQALSEEKPIYPRQFLESIIEDANK